MAASFEDAFAQIAGPEFDRIVYGGRRFHRVPENLSLADALKGLDREWLRRVAGWIVGRDRCNHDDAEDAIEDEVLYLLEKEQDAFYLQRDVWMRLLFWRGRYRLLRNRAAPWLASTNAIEEALGDGAIADGEICVPISPQAEENAGDDPLPRPGGPWGRRQVISGLQRVCNASTTTTVDRPAHASADPSIDYPRTESSRLTSAVSKRHSSPPASSPRNLDDVGGDGRQSRQLVPVGRSIDRTEFGQGRATPNVTRTSCRAAP